MIKKPWYGTQWVSGLTNITKLNDLFFYFSKQQHSRQVDHRDHRLTAAPSWEILKNNTVAEKETRGGSPHSFEISR